MLVVSRMSLISPKFRPKTKARAQIKTYIFNLCLPGQIERVYRDINSMIDTLGLNGRSLKAFIKGHKLLYRDVLYYGRKGIILAESSIQNPIGD